MLSSTGRNYAPAPSQLLPQKLPPAPKKPGQSEDGWLQSANLPEGAIHILQGKHPSRGTRTFQECSVQPKARIPWVREEKENVRGEFVVTQHISGKCIRNPAFSSFLHLSCSQEKVMNSSLTEDALRHCQSPVPSAWYGLRQERMVREDAVPQQQNKSFPRADDKKAPSESLCMSTDQATTATTVNSCKRGMSSQVPS